MNIEQRRRAVLSRRGHTPTGTVRTAGRNALVGLAVTLAGMGIMDSNSTIGLAVFASGLLFMVTAVTDLDERGTR